MHHNNSQLAQYINPKTEQKKPIEKQVAAETPLDDSNIPPNAQDGQKPSAEPVDNNNNNTVDNNKTKEPEDATKGSVDPSEEPKSKIRTIL